MCSIIEVADKGINTILVKVVEPLLTTPPLYDTDPSSSPTYAVWQSMQTLANVFFVIIFLVMIFANTVQLNIETYAIKKMLPKFVAAVILVQFSYVISAVIIDLGNILGEGISGLVNVGVLHGIATGSTGTLTFMEGALGFAAVGLLIIAVPGLLTLAVVALIGAAGVLLTLVVRQLLIIMLVVLSPLAFAAWVLPNTERFFKMWLSNFIKISLMYAMIMMLFAVASIGTYTQNHAPSYDNTGGLSGIIASLFPIIAFFMVPMTFKWAGGAMSFAAGFVADRTSGAKSSAANKVENSKPMQALQARRAAKKEARLTNWATEDEPKAFGSRKLGNVRKGAYSRWMTGSVTGKGEYVERQQEALRRQAEKAREELYAGTGMGELKDIAKADTTSLQDAVVIGKMASKQGALDMEDFQQAIWKKMGLDQDPNNATKRANFQKLMSEVVDVNHGGIKKDSILMETFNANAGDAVDENGHIIMGAATAMGLSQKNADRIFNQTGTGQKTIVNSKVSLGGVKEALRQHEAGEVKLEADVVRNLQTARAAGEAAGAGDTTAVMEGRQMISEAVKRTAAQSPILSARWHGEDANAMMGGQVSAFSGASRGRDDLGDLGETGTTPTTPTPSTPPSSGGGSGETVSPGGVILPPGVSASEPEEPDET
ncbi:MAG TPA: hypothetical protein VMR75_04215 [Candidatus Saccharimonadales bacterium]|nr:hypothetical protein [Candidatus Saccharimonadales bacterium]